MEARTLILHGSRISLEDTGITGLREATIQCSSCCKELARELWMDRPNSPYEMSLPEGYVRIIFGVHPEIVSSVPAPVPAVYTPVCFCKRCEEEKKIVYKLLHTLLCLEVSHSGKDDYSQLDPNRGCWITIWPLDTMSQPRWPIDYQMNIDTFREIVSGIKNFSGNPFRIA